MNNTQVSAAVTSLMSFVQDRSVGDVDVNAARVGKQAAQTDTREKFSALLRQDDERPQRERPRKRDEDQQDASAAAVQPPAQQQPIERRADSEDKPDKADGAEDIEEASAQQQEAPSQGVDAAEADTKADQLAALFKDLLLKIQDNLTPHTKGEDDEPKEETAVFHFDEAPTISPMQQAVVENLAGDDAAVLSGYTSPDAEGAVTALGAASTEAQAIQTLTSLAEQLATAANAQAATESTQAAVSQSAAQDNAVVQVPVHKKPVELPDTASAIAQQRVAQLKPVANNQDMPKLELPQHSQGSPAPQSVVSIQADTDAQLNDSGKDDSGSSQPQTTAPLGQPNAVQQQTQSNSGTFLQMVQASHETNAADAQQVQIKATAHLGNNHIQIQLRPEDLGKLEIRLDVGVDGKTTLSVTTDNVRAYQLLSNEADALRRILTGVGLQPDAGSLSFNLRGEGQQGQQQQGENRHDNRRDADAVDEILSAVPVQYYALEETDRLDIRI